jgi:hypothetical protein
VLKHLSAVEERLLEEMDATARGPKRNGLFALWLIVRQCESALPPESLSEKACASRLSGLERRLSSLTLPAPLRRALPASSRELRSQHANRVPVTLQQLSAPAREAIGPVAGDALLLAARNSRRAIRAAAVSERG